jgi:hypothetical protein
MLFAISRMLNGSFKACSVLRTLENTGDRGDLDEPDPEAELQLDEWMT